MIITRISGGIGNQLFQYALGRSLSLNNDDTLKLDAHWYGLGPEPGRSFELGHFAISAGIAEGADFKAIGIPNPKKQDAFSKMRWKTRRVIEGLRPLNRRRIVLEPAFSFCPEISGIKGSRYLSGVWQSEKYFAKHAGQIRKDLRLSAPLSEAAQHIAETIQSGGASSVSLHVRRGDMVTDPHLSKKYGILSEDYYRQAVECIRQSVPSPQLFIFSDDIAWCRGHLALDLPTIYVSGSQNISDYEELVLMSQCAHNIIAKSSFSWWGAWLNQNPGKIIVAPKQWFGSTRNDDKDLIPDAWIRL